jgi:3-oxoacyl-(acyl-carrier-protein) synthase III
MNIRAKLSLTFVLLMIFGVTAISSYAILFIRNYLLDSGIETMERHARWMALSVRELPDDGSFELTVAEMAKASGYDVGLYDADSTLFVAFGSGRAADDERVNVFADIPGSRNAAIRLELSLPRETLFEPVKTIRWIIYTGMFISIGIILLVSNRVATSLSRPIRALNDAALRIANGDVTHQVELARSDEFGTLATSINRMSERLRADLNELEAASERQTQFYADIEGHPEDAAVQRALEQSGTPLDEIDGIIMATIIPDQPVPAMASALARELGIPGVFAFDLNAACSGWLYALEVGRSLICGGSARSLIVVTAELLSRITNPTDHETAFLFGDGAGAAILSRAPGGHRLHRMALAGDATQFTAIQRRGGGALRPVPEPGGKDRADFYLQMNGAMVFKSAVVAFADQIEATLKRHGLRPEDIAWVVPHQANERILRAVSKRVGIPFEKVVMTIDRYGNTSGASVSMALGWAAQEGIFQPGDRIIFCSVGAGLTFAGGLLVW